MIILEIKLNRLTELISGIIIHEGTDNFILLNNSQDYFLDGITFINGNFIKEVYQIENNLKEIIFKEKIKNYKSDIDFFSELGDVKLFLNKIKDKHLIELVLDSSDYILIGSVLKMNKKSFRINLIDTDGIFFKEETIMYDKIRAITVKNDYLNSLEIFLNKTTRS